MVAAALDRALALNSNATQVGGADVPDLNSLHADACGPGYSYDLNQRLLLESKKHMRARGIRSPDEWDAVALTFAEPVKDAGRNKRPAGFTEAIMIRMPGRPRSGGSLGPITSDAVGHCARVDNQSQAIANGQTGH
jgi:hypothetical protein